MQNRSISRLIVMALLDVVIELLFLLTLKENVIYENCLIGYRLGALVHSLRCYVYVGLLP